MNQVNSQISSKAKIYREVFIRDSVVEANSLLADNAVILSSVINEHVHIDRGAYIQNSSFGYGSYVGKDSLVKFTNIGKYCNLSWQLSIGGSNHNYKAACMYTHSWWKRTFGAGEGMLPVLPEEYTHIGNDVWIGAQANILRGVTIGDGAVIGANTLVLSDIPPYAIAVGSPAKVIKYRFDEETIRRLEKIQWWNWDPKTIVKAKEYLQNDLSQERLEALENISKDINHGKNELIN